MVTKFLTLSKKLETLEDVKKKIADGVFIVFDENKRNFGFRKLDQLYPVSDEEIKGYPCIAYNKKNDQMKYGVKVIPLENEHQVDGHPVNIEITLLKELNKMVEKRATPHITAYFKDMELANNSRVLTDFPLKALRKYIHRKTRVLISEYVPAGNISEWAGTNDVTEAQWKYIVFSMMWTLLVLQDKFGFLHNDFHYGNVLIDNTITAKRDMQYKYTLEGRREGEKTEFYVDQCGILPKMWDFEFAKTCNDTLPECNVNPFFKETDERIPFHFTPYHDVHYFLTSLLSSKLDIPASLRNMINSYYPDYLISKEDDSSSGSSSDDASSGAESDDADDDEGSESVEEPKKLQKEGEEDEEGDETDVFYATDEAMDATEEAEDDEKWKFECDELATVMCEKYGFPEKEALRFYYDEHERTILVTDRSETETEFMIEDRLRVGIESELKELPTALDVLMNPYFDEYRTPPKNGRKRGTEIEFNYALTSSSC